MGDRIPKLSYAAIFFKEFQECKTNSISCFVKGTAGKRVVDDQLPLRCICQAAKLCKPYLLTLRFVRMILKTGPLEVLHQ